MLLFRKSIYLVTVRHILNQNESRALFDVQLRVTNKHLFCFAFFEQLPTGWRLVHARQPAQIQVRRNPIEDFTKTITMGALPIPLKRQGVHMCNELYKTQVIYVVDGTRFVDFLEAAKLAGRAVLVKSSDFCIPSRMLRNESLTCRVLFLK